MSIIVTKDPLEGDALQYMHMAENLYKTGIYTYDGITPSRALQPVYPMMLTLLYWETGEHLIIVRTLQTILGLASFLLALLLFRRMVGNHYIFLASAALALYVPLWFNAGLILTEMTTIFLLVAFGYALRRGLIESSWQSLLLSGLLLGIAILTRPIVISLAVMIWLPIIGGSNSWRRKMLTLVPVGAGILIALLPWAMRNYYSCERFTPLPPGGAANLLFASSKDTPQARDSLLYITAGEQEERLSEGTTYSTALHNIVGDPAGFLWRGVKRIAWVWSFIPGTRQYLQHLPGRILTNAASFTLLVLALLGLIRLPLRDRVFLLYPPLSFSLLFFFTHTTPRYLLPIMPFILIAACIGLIHIIESYRRSKARP
jgi:4-amino-4-deoxy-L-arabinose transferase-like glycosyltransferase